MAYILKGRNFLKIILNTSLIKKPELDANIWTVWKKPNLIQIWYLESRIQKWVFRTFLPMQSRKEEENDELIAVYI